jgi:hypothetical protein
MDTTDAPQIIEHINQQINYTPYDNKWVPFSKRFVSMGIRPNATGAMQLYELNRGELQLVADVTKPHGIKCGTFGASSIEERHLATGPTSPLHHFITASLYHCITLSLHHFFTSSLHHCITLSLLCLAVTVYCTTVRPCHFVTLPLRHSTAAPLLHKDTVPIYHCHCNSITWLLRHSITASCRCTTVPLCHSTTAIISRSDCLCITLPLHHSAISEV